MGTHVFFVGRGVLPYPYVCMWVLGGASDYQFHAVRMFLESCKYEVLNTCPLKTAISWLLRIAKCWARTRKTIC